MKLSPDHKAYLAFHRYLWQECPDVPYGPKSLYSCLLTYEHSKKNTCWVCQETLSHHLGCAISSLKLWTEFLEDKDMIRCERTLRGKKRHIRYELFHPQHRNKSLLYVSRSKKDAENVVPFPSLTCQNSTLSTTPLGGSTAST